MNLFIKKEYNFKEILCNSFSQASIRIILTPHLTLKIFLSTFVLASSGFASYFVIKSFMDYFSYRVSTETRTVYETPTLFPKVTICNINWFTTQYAFNSLQNGNNNPNNLLSFLKKLLAHNLSDILIDCKFNSNPFNKSDFVWSFDKDYGNCYTFNSGFGSNGNKTDLKKSTISGPDYGLSLTVYVNFYEELMSYSSGLGALIRIGNSSYSTFYSNGGILVSSGFQTNIVVEREFKSVLSKPYSNCEIDSKSPDVIPNLELYNLISQSEYAYTQQLCFIQCYEKFIISKYNCSLSNFISLFLKVSKCSTKLFNNISNSADDLESSFINSVCLPLCPLECNQTLYKTSISSYQLIGSNFVSYILDNKRLASDFINRTLDANTARESFVRVNIFYDILSYTVSTESPQIELVALLASIGGNLGLFLGVSVFSLAEIVEVFIEILLKMRRH